MEKILKAIINSLVFHSEHGQTYAAYLQIARARELLNTLEERYYKEIYSDKIMR